MAEKNPQTTNLILKDKKPRKESFTHPIDKALMVIVPAGTSWYGSRGDDVDAAKEEQPQRELYLHSFYIDAYPVTRAQFCMFLNSWKPDDASLNKWIKLGDNNCRITPEKGEYVVEKDFGNHPVTFVSWHGAVEHACWAGKRLLGACPSKSKSPFLATRNCGLSKGSPQDMAAKSITRTHS
jgi:formylglycine-generating enzyme required for sulfatase activity